MAKGVSGQDDAKYLLFLSKDECHDGHVVLFSFMRSFSVLVLK